MLITASLMKRVRPPHFSVRQIQPPARHIWHSSSQWLTKSSQSISRLGAATRVHKGAGMYPYVRFKYVYGAGRDRPASQMSEGAVESRYTCMVCVVLRSSEPAGCRIIAKLTADLNRQGIAPRPSVFFAHEWSSFNFLLVRFQILGTPRYIVHGASLVSIFSSSTIVLTVVATAFANLAGNMAPVGSSEEYAFCAFSR